jgi:hypothetical protein
MNRIHYLEGDIFCQSLEARCIVKLQTCYTNRKKQLKMLNAGTKGIAYRAAIGSGM